MKRTEVVGTLALSASMALVPSGWPRTWFDDERGVVGLLQGSRLPSDFADSQSAPFALAAERPAGVD